MILLDTHIWIWPNRGTSQIPTPVAKAINEGEKLAISVVSIGEALMLFEKGRLQSPVPAEQEIRKWLGNAITVIPVEEEIAFLSRTLAFEHEDPADRFIAATAFHLELPIATADRNLLQLAWLKHV